MFKKTLFLSLFLLCSQPLHAAGIKHDFIVHIGIFDASRTSFEYNLDKKRYLTKSEVKTNGFFDTVYPFTAEYYTSGDIMPDGSFKTQVYRYKSKTRSNRRAKEMFYNKEGLPVYRISSKNDKSKKVNITQDPQNAGTTDLQTVFAEISKQYAELRFCDSRMEVFDGKRRFDVIFKDEGIEELPANEYSDISGKAAKCSMYIDKLGSKEDDLLWELTSDRPIYFWLMEDKDKKMPFIARISINETPLGKLDAYAKKITIKDN